MMNTAALIIIMNAMIINGTAWFFFVNTFYTFLFGLPFSLLFFINPSALRLTKK
jgi:hypothetical protein